MKYVKIIEPVTLSAYPGAHIESAIKETLKFCKKNNTTAYLSFNGKKLIIGQESRLMKIFNDFNTNMEDDLP